jgi:hypothetical protein
LQAGANRLRRRPQLETFGIVAVGNRTGNALGEKEHACNTLVTIVTSDAESSGLGEICRAQTCFWEDEMATRKNGGSHKKSSGRTYGKAAGKSVGSAVRREKRGTLRSGKGGKGGVVKSRKQAIAIGLSEARKKGAKVPEKAQS